MRIIRLIFCLIFMVIAPTFTKAQTFTGSGFFVSPSGLFITNHHVIEGADEIRVRTVDGAVYRAHVLRHDPNNDLALLRVEGSGFLPLTIAQSVNVRRGEPVFALGFPQIHLQGLEPKLTEGSISSLSGMTDDPRHFQISNPIQPGNSGGPLVLEDGRLVGVIQSSLRAKVAERVPQNVNYAIKSSLVLEFLAGQNIGATGLAEGRSIKRTDMIANVERSIGLVIAAASRPERRKLEAPPLPPSQGGASESTPFPQRQITIIVPFAAGGPSDVIARRLADSLGRVLGVPVSVTNELGDAGLAGTRIAAQAVPDGYTLLFQNTSLLWASQMSGQDAPKLLAGLAPIGKAIDIPMIIAANSQTGINSLSGLREWVRARGSITIAHASPGSPSHVCASLANSVLLQGRAKLVDYRGVAPAVAAVAGASNELICEQSSSIRPFLQRNLNGVAIVTPNRLTTSFGVTTLLEQGSDSFMEYWGALFAPRSTPPAVIAKLSHALQTALQDVELRKSLLQVGANPSPTEQATPDYLFAQIRKDAQRSARVGR